MRPEEFGPGSPGRLVRTEHGVWAYVPGVLPPELALDWAIVRMLGEAERAAGELAGFWRGRAEAGLVTPLLVRREAVASSRIEGMRAGLTEVLLFEVSGREVGDVREVANCVAALEHGIAQVGNVPVSLWMIRQLHGMLMDGMDEGHKRPGAFRTEQAFIGSEVGRGIEHARFVPPPAIELPHVLNDLERFVRSESELPFLVRMALIHYQFEAIHPFGDGNGRVGRLLVLLFLAERGLLPQPLLYLSAYFERTRSTYYDLLLRVSTHGDWIGWITYFLEGVRVQAANATELADRLLGLQARYRTALQSARRTANSLALVDHLFVNPIVSASSVQRALGISAPTALATIRILEREGMVREVTGRKWGMAFQADEILELVRGEDGP